MVSELIGSGSLSLRGCVGWRAVASPAVEPYRVVLAVPATIAAVLYIMQRPAPCASTSWAMCLHIIRPCTIQPVHAMYSMSMAVRCWHVAGPAHVGAMCACRTSDSVVSCHKRDKTQWAVPNPPITADTPISPRVHLLPPPATHTLGAPLRPHPECNPTMTRSKANGRGRGAEDALSASSTERVLTQITELYTSGLSPGSSGSMGLKVWPSFVCVRHARQRSSRWGRGTSGRRCCGRFVGRGKVIKCRRIACDSQVRHRCIC